MRIWMKDKMQISENFSSSKHEQRAQDDPGGESCGVGNALSLLVDFMLEPFNKVFSLPSCFGKLCFHRVGLKSEVIFKNINIKNNSNRKCFMVSLPAEGHSRLK